MERHTLCTPDGTDRFTRLKPDEMIMKTPPSAGFFLPDDRPIEVAAETSLSSVKLLKDCY